MNKVVKITPSKILFSKTLQYDWKTKKLKPVSFCKKLKNVIEIIKLGGKHD